MSAELAALLALGQSRRAAGLPCNPRRDPVAAVDFLTEEEIQRAYYLTLRRDLAARTGVAA